MVVKLFQRVGAGSCRRWKKFQGKAGRGGCEVGHGTPRMSARLNTESGLGWLLTNKSTRGRPRAASDGPLGVIQKKFRRENHECIIRHTIYHINHFTTE